MICVFYSYTVDKLNHLFISESIFIVFILSPLGCEIHIKSHHTHNLCCCLTYYRSGNLCSEFACSINLKVKIRRKLIIFAMIFRKEHIYLYNMYDNVPTSENVSLNNFANCSICSVYLLSCMHCVE